MTVDMFKQRIIEAIMSKGVKEMDAVMQYNYLSQSDKKELLEEWWEMKEREKYKEM